MAEDLQERNETVRRLRIKLHQRRQELKESKEKIEELEGLVGSATGIKKKAKPEKRFGNLKIHSTIKCIV